MLWRRESTHNKLAMRARKFLLFFSMIAAPAAAQQQSLGIFGSWGAFEAPGRCWAVAEPVRSREDEGARPFAAVGHWPARGVAGQFHLRLGREKRERSAVLLRVDGRTFQLAGRGRDAWAPDAGADAEILAAIRTGIEMTVETRSADGRILRDHYLLRGAASAIDAAAIACAPRR